MRLKVRMTVQRELTAGTVLQQGFIATYVVRNQQCVDCQAEYRQGTWKSLVQVRQHVRHKRTFLYLEQLILKHQAHRNCISIETFRDGMDFYFPDKGKSAKFMSFLESVVPTQVRSSKKLISTDVKSNISNYKHTNLVEIPPVCKNDLILLSKKMANNLGNIARLVIVKNVTSLIRLLDPLTGQTATLSTDGYWREPLRIIVTAARSRFTRFVVLSKEALVLRRNVSRKSISKRNRSKLAKVVVVKEDELGVAGECAELEQDSHVGYLLSCGDICLGYDLREVQFEDEEGENLRRNGNLPDIILLKKLYGGGEDNYAKKRIWKLDRLDVAVTESNSKKDVEMEHTNEEDFYRELESDKEMRSRLNLFKSDAIKKRDDMILEEEHEDDDEDEDDQKIKLDELLDNLDLNDGPDVENVDPSEFKEDILEELLEQGDRATQEGISYVGKEESRK